MNIEKSDILNETGERNASREAIDKVVSAIEDDEKFTEILNACLGGIMLDLPTIFNFISRKEEHEPTPIEWEKLKDEEQQEIVARINAALEKHSPGLKAEPSEGGIDIYLRERNE